MALNRARIAQDITLQANGPGFDYVIVVEFFDSVDSATTLWAETFVLSSGATTTDLQNAVIKRGQDIRAALAKQAGARTAAPNGTTITVS